MEIQKSLGSQLARSANTERLRGERHRTSGHFVSKSGKQNTPARHKATQAHENILSVMYCLISHSKPDCSDGGATLFLAGADHGYCEKEKRTRQNNLQSATVSLQVVIGLCKRKETAALKSKPPFQMGVSNCLLYDGFFSFAVARQI